MNVKVTTDVTSEPILLKDVKNYIKESYGTDALEDALLDILISSAREAAERYCNRSLAAKTIQVFWFADEINDMRLILPYGPHGTITSVYSVDQDGTETALTLNTGYHVRGVDMKEIEISQLSTVSSDGGSLDLDYKVTVPVGYGNTGLETLPSFYKVALLKTVAEWYLNREDLTMNLSSSVMSILNQGRSKSYL